MRNLLSEIRTVFATLCIGVALAFMPDDLPCSNDVMVSLRQALGALT
jgi:hypothetical protein